MAETNSCAGCGATEKLSSIYGQIYRGPKDGSHLKALAKVNICDKCMKGLLAFDINTRTVGICKALAGSIQGGYNAILGARR